MLSVEKRKIVVKIERDRYIDEGLAKAAASTDEFEIERLRMPKESVERRLIHLFRDFRSKEECRERSGRIIADVTKLGNFLREK